MNHKNNERKTQIILISVIAVLAVIAVAVIGMAIAMNFTTSNVTEDAGDNNTSSVTDTNNTQSPKPDASNFLDGIDTEGAKEVEFTMTDGQKFVITVLPKVAPETAENFLKLVSSGFYDGLTFHRIIDGFMAQGGDPEGTGMGGSDTNIKGEFASNGFDNPLSHQRSVVSMARSNDPDSASSQFFICYDDASMSLDGNYAAFGYVSEGMETVDSFLSAGTDESDRPLKEVKIQSAVLR